MTEWGLEFTRLSGRDVTPKVSRIPADTTPAEEIGNFMNVMKMISAKVQEITAGVEWIVNMVELKQVYRIRLVQMDEIDTQVDMRAVVIIYDSDGKVAS